MLVRDYFPKLRSKVMWIYGERTTLDYVLYLCANPISAMADLHVHNFPHLVTFFNNLRDNFSRIILSSITPKRKRTDVYQRTKFTRLVSISRDPISRIRPSPLECLESKSTGQIEDLKIDYVF